MKKGTLKNVVMYLLTAVLSVLIIIYIGYHLTRAFSSGIETQAASVVTRENTLSVEGYIMRHETMIYPTASGTVNYTVPDGTKVSSGDVVVQVCSGESVRDRISEIDAELSLLENSWLGKNLTLSDTSGIDQQIGEQYETVCRRLAAGDIEYACYRRDSLLALLNKRRLVMKNISGDDYGERIEALKAEKAALTGETGDIVEEIKAGTAGYFYSTTDGYEKAFDSSKYSSMSLEDFRFMVSSEPNERFTAEGGCIGKVVTDYVWYLAIVLPAETYREIPKKTYYDVIFPYSSDARVRMKLEREVITAENDDVLLFFSCGEHPENFSFLRSQQVELVTESYTGYGVPFGAVHLDEEGQRGVYVLDGSTVRFRSVSILAQSGDGYVVAEYDTEAEAEADAALAAEMEGAEEEAIKAAQSGRLRGLRMYEFVIIKGKDLYDGKVIS